MYEWPIDEISAQLDQPVKGVAPDKFRVRLIDHGYGESIVLFLTQLYEHANGGTFYDGAFRIIPMEGSKKQKVPGLAEWNDPTDWKQFGPGNNSAFYFCMNAFGDQFGVPIDENREIAKDRVGVLWVDEYKYEKSGFAWNNILTKLLADEDDMAKYLARLPEYEWATKFLGKPDLRQCFSWDRPPVLGGSESIDNLKIISIPVHVSFILQVIKESKERNDTGRE